MHGILPHHARQLSDAAASICKCFKSTLEAHPVSSDNRPPPKRARLIACSSPPLLHQQPAQADPSTQQQQQQPTTHLQSVAEPRLAQKQLVANLEQQQQQQQQQQLPEQLLQQLTQHQHFPQQLLDQVKHLQHGQQLLLHQHQQQHGQQQQQAQSPGHGAQPHACHSPVVESQTVGGATSPLHATPSQDPTAMPTAQKDDNADVHQQQHQQQQQQQQQPYHAQQANHAQNHCREEDLPPEQHATTAAAGSKHMAEGVWQVLLQAAVAHDEELCQQLTQQCREEEMDVSPGLKLASREQFEELALMADYSLSNLSLAGDREATVCIGHRLAAGGLEELMLIMSKSRPIILTR